MADIREIAICRVSLLNNAQYERSNPALPGKEAGVNEYRLRVEGEDLTQRQLAVLRYTDAMTKNVAISDDVFQDLKRYFTGMELVEITVTIAAYNCCS